MDITDGDEEQNVSSCFTDCCILLDVNSATNGSFMDPMHSVQRVVYTQHRETEYDTRPNKGWAK